MLRDPRTDPGLINLLTRFYNMTSPRGTEYQKRRVQNTHGALSRTLYGIIQSYSTNTPVQGILNTGPTLWQIAEDMDPGFDFTSYDVIDLGRDVDDRISFLLDEGRSHGSIPSNVDYATFFQQLAGALSLQNIARPFWSGGYTQQGSSLPASWQPDITKSSDMPMTPIDKKGCSCSEKGSGIGLGAVIALMLIAGVVGGSLGSLITQSATGRR